MTSNPPLKGFALIELIFIIGVVGVLFMLATLGSKPVQQPQDEMSVHIQRAKDAKTFKTGYEARFSKFADFCGSNENVWVGIDSGDGTYGVFGCKDYSKVPDENL